MIQSTDTIDTLNKRADNGLYIAKEDGRDTYKIT
jgi:GGDEF domain-containing protein